MLRKFFTPVALIAVVITGCDRAPSPVAAPSSHALSAHSSATLATSASEPAPGITPSAVPAAPVISPCDFRSTPVAPSPRPVAPPPNGAAPTDPEIVSAVVKTDQGDIPLTLTPGKTPCTVLNFLSLAQQHFYDNTKCHRLTTDGIFVLQCGDPTATGTGGPGYSFADEYPIGSRTAPSPGPGDTLYTRGVLAMANSGPDTNGSQFFLVTKDSPLPPHYTIFGSTDEAGLEVLDKIAGGGVLPGPTSESDGEPKVPVQILGVQGP
ncbi:MAG: peptidylprolyl isomerase [Segniliparus sp.]|uniref:peptidylprolyl isomerase n=1 Tax=Segniliparus sp. TaxID=2804064 RepID=UPI003F31B05E